MRDRKPPRYPRLAAAIAALGTTRLERASKLDSQAKTIDRLLTNDLPIQFRPFVARPELLRALADDLEAAQSPA